MKIFMTGATGFLGSHLAKSLRDQGHEVTNFGRRQSDQLESMGVKQVQGDLVDPDSLELLKSSLEHCDVCFHVASKVAMWGKWQDFYDVNVVGTQNLIKACKESGIRHFIYTSTPSVVFDKDSLCLEDESLSYVKKSCGLYARSKVLAEQFVLSQKSDHFHVVSLRPHMIFGPGDQNIIPGLLKAADEGRLVIVGDGENLVDVTYVSNAVDAHLYALNKITQSPSSISGEAFFIGQGPVKLWSFIDEILSLYNRPKLKKKIPFRLAYLIGFLCEAIYGVLGTYDRDPKMTRFISLQLAKSHYYSHEKAASLLGWSPKVSLQEALSKDML